MPQDDQKALGETPMLNFTEQELTAVQRFGW